jgi:hypothetical protein
MTKDEDLSIGKIENGKGFPFFLSSSGEVQLCTDDRPVKISGIKNGSISELSIRNSEGIPEIAITTKIGTIKLVEGIPSREDFRSPERGLLHFTREVEGKIYYLTPNDWEPLEGKDLPPGCQFPKDAVCIPVDLRFKRMG